MKRPIIFILVVGVLLGLLARSGSKENETTPVVDTFRSEYISGCTSEDASYAYCECTHDYLVSNYGKNQMMEMALELRDGTYSETNLPPKLKNAIIFCADKL